MASIDEELAKAVAVKKIATDAEKELKAAVVARWRADGIKSRDAMIGGRKVACVSVSNNDGAEVTDERAFNQWCAATFNDDELQTRMEINMHMLTDEEYAELANIAERIHPYCVTAYMEPKPEPRASLIASLMEGTNGECVTPEGEVVPGMEWRHNASVRVSKLEPRQVVNALRLAYGEDYSGLLGGAQ